MVNRKILVKVHVVFAAFFLSIATMFVVTGALYTADIKPHSSNNEYRVRQKAPLQNDARYLKSIVRHELAKLGVQEPLGKTNLRKDKKRNSYKLVWKGLNHNVSIRPSSVDPEVAVITITKPSWYNRLMAMHKAKGGDAFGILAIATAIALLLQFATGIVLAIQTAILRRLTIYSMSAGAAVFAGLVVVAQMH